jgi:tetratricopeptide (TPR) repeat protein
MAYSIVFNLLASVEARGAARFMTANSLRNSGRVDEAILLYQKAIEIEPSQAMTHFNLGVAYLSKRQPDAAIPELERALELDPKIPRAHCDLGNAMLQNGRAEQAIMHWQRALELQPDYPEALNNLAWALATQSEASLRDGAQAIKYAERACELTHYGVTGMVGTLAAAYAKAGRYDDAISTAQKACDLATKDGEAELLKKNQDLLALYLKHLPYHESNGIVRSPVP